MTPKVRQWLYTASAAASAIIPLLVAYKVIDTSVAGAWVNVIGVLGALATGGAATAAVVTAKQRHDGTLDFTGSPAEQAVAAIQATVSRAAHSATDLEKVRGAVTEVLGGVTEAAVNTVDTVVDVIAPGSLVDRLLDTVRPND